MEPACKLVVNSAARHFFQRDGKDTLQSFIVRTNITINDQVNDRGMRKLWGTAEAAIRSIEHPQRSFDDLVDNAGRELNRASSQRFRLRNRSLHQLRLFRDIGVFALM